MNLLLVRKSSHGKCVRIKRVMLQFNNLFQFMAKEWEQLKANNELHVLEATVIEGNKMAHLYRSKSQCDLTFLSCFSTVRGIILLALYT